MNLAKAIEILELNLKVANKKMPPDVKDALQLGIEALNLVATMRKGSPPSAFPLLPGETEN